MFKVVLDYDGTLTAEEHQSPMVVRSWLMELAFEVLHVPFEEVELAYRDTVACLRSAPHKYSWQVNGVCASYCDEGAFIFNTAALQTMVATNSAYAKAVASHFANAEYDPIAALSHHLFHTHTASLEAPFRESTSKVLHWLITHPKVEPLVLTNSLGDKVVRNLARLDLPPIRVLGDTRQYELDVAWTPPFGGRESFLVVDDLHTVDLRRHTYYEALSRELDDASCLVIIADTLSLPGALPLAMGVPFALLRTSYTPDWCAAYVRRHPLGMVLDSLAALPAWLEYLIQ